MTSGLFTLHGIGTGTRTRTTGDMGQVPFPFSDQCEHFCTIYYDPLVPFLFPVPVLVPLPCSSKQRIQVCG